jgi:predicted MFS family arabinose efflux permease
MEYFDETLVVIAKILMATLLSLSGVYAVYSFWKKVLLEESYY